MQHNSVIRFTDIGLGLIELGILVVDTQGLKRCLALPVQRWFKAAAKIAPSRMPRPSSPFYELMQWPCSFWNAMFEVLRNHILAMIPHISPSVLCIILL